MFYSKIFLIAFLLSVIFTFLQIKVSTKLNFLDHPQGRKAHQKPIPYGGGIGLFLSFLVLAFFFIDQITSFDSNSFLGYKETYGFILAGFLILLIGVLDDKYSLKGRTKLFLEFVPIAIIIISGIGIDYLTNPFGGLAYNLNIFSIPITIDGMIFKLSILADVITFIWIIIIMNAINFMDGIDGLAGGVGFIGSFILFILSLADKINQPEIATISIIFAGSLLGFLVFNFSKAKIFLGDGWALLIGLILAVLAIYSGGKLSTTFLVLGLPVIDVFWTVLDRFKKHGNLFKAFTIGDRTHFHHLLQQRWLPNIRTVLIIYSICLFNGISALLLNTQGKIFMMIGLFFAIGYFRMVLKKDRKIVKNMI